MEDTPELFVAKMVEVFREVRRVLRDDGTLWLNFGDSYSGSRSTKGAAINPNSLSYNAGCTKAGVSKPIGVIPGLKEKDMIGIPWMVAFALRADGWYLRSDIIWSKPNPMPESVTDRPTKAHEYVFLLTKKAKYYYDADAIREPHVTQEDRPDGIIRNRLFAYDSKENQLRSPKNLNRVEGVHNMHKAREMARHGTNIPGHSGDYNANGERILNPNGRNRRTVWEIATQPTPEAHFATFPEALVEPCIKAGTSERGCCSVCGAPMIRTVEKEFYGNWEHHRTEDWDTNVHNKGHKTDKAYKPPITTGWQPSCSCNADTVPCVVLDPFGGSGTTAKVARDLKRGCILIELNPAYVKIMRNKLRLNEQLVSA
jgi:DNA modification methylase